MRLIVLSFISLSLASAAHAYSYPHSVVVGLTLEKVNAKTGQVLSPQGFHSSQVGFSCQFGSRNILAGNYTYAFLRTNDNETSYAADSAATLKHDFSGDEDCLRLLEVLLNTKNNYKVLLMVDDEGSMTDLRFCSNQANPDDCMAQSFNLEHLP